MPTNSLKKLRSRLIFAVTLAVAGTIAWFTTGCADSNTATSPSSYRSNMAGSLLGGQSDSLFVCAADSVAQTDTATIGMLGGTINFGPHSLMIPPGALLTPTLITATMPADGHLTAVLQPSGLQFILPATLTLAYGQCNPPPSSSLSIVYLSGPLGQILDWLPSVLNLNTNTVSAPIAHFSVYAGAERQ
jgi:hypothetical protein